MIPYKYPYEQEFLLHYAKKLENIKAKEVLEKDGIQCSEDARKLASFFWEMIDQTVIDSDTNPAVAGFTNLESLCEDVMQSLRSHFIATGYMEIWEEESDKA